MNNINQSELNSAFSEKRKCRKNILWKKKQGLFVQALTALAVILSVGVMSCHKSVTPAGTASLSILNAVVGSKPLYTNFSDGDKISYAGGTLFSLSYGLFTTTDQLKYTGNVPLWILTDTTSTVPPLLKMNLNLPISSINSLFLTGTLDQPDTLFTRDTLQVFSAADSTTTFRFLNLAPGPKSITVNIQGQASGSEVANLPYKGVTSFKSYPATSAVTNYVFEFRDALTNAVITTYTARSVGTDGGIYTPNKWLYKNNTLAFIGQIDSTGTKAPRVIVITNY